MSDASPAWRRVLVLGGARSGKSSFAEQVATACGEPVLYVATAQANDDEMRERIEHHRARRQPTWHTLEARVDVAARVAAALEDSRTIVLEDLTLLLSNQFEAHAAEDAERRALTDVEALLALPAHLVIVSNEVGMGVVPSYPLGRAFRDALGRLNQYTAARVNEAFLVVAGLPQRLK